MCSALRWVGVTFLCLLINLWYDCGWKFRVGLTTLIKGFGAKITHCLTNVITNIEPHCRLPFEPLSSSSLLEVIIYNSIWPDFKSRKWAMYKQIYNEMQLKLQCFSFSFEINVLIFLVTCLAQAHHKERKQIKGYHCTEP